MIISFRWILDKFCNFAPKLSDYCIRLVIKNNCSYYKIYASGENGSASNFFVSSTRRWIDMPSGVTKDQQKYSRRFKPGCHLPIRWKKDIRFRVVRLVLQCGWIGGPIGTVSQRVPILGTRFLQGYFGFLWGPIYISRFLISIFWAISCKECQFSLHVCNIWSKRW